MNQAKDYSKFKCGYVALLGRPNVGKSTLMNAILDFKLSIVTPKPQTTRHRILGIHFEKNLQIIFLDTPGIIKPRYKLQEYLVKAAHSAAKDADLHLFIRDAQQPENEDDAALLEGLLKQKKPVIVCLNKIDQIKKPEILPQIEALSKLDGITEIIPISALKEDGIPELVEAMKRYLPFGPPLYPEDQMTTAPERFFVSELIRERIFQRYSEEIPYSTTVTVEEFKEREGGKDYIRATIYVERDSQKAILIGKKGAALKRVGSEAREAIQELTGRPVFLDLFVAVRPKWRDNENLLRAFGYN